MASSSTSAIRFNCPHCGGRVKAPPGLGGERFQCPRCGADIIAPGGQPQSPSSGAPSASAPPVGNAPRERQAATTSPPPSPRNTSPPRTAPTARVSKVTMPANAKSAEPLPKPRREEPAAERQENQKKKAPREEPKPAELTVRCSVCETRIDTTEDKIGTEIDCPDCHSKVTVRSYKKKPPPPKNPILQPLGADGDDLIMGDLIERPHFRSLSVEGPTPIELEIISPSQPQTVADTPPVAPQPQTPPIQPTAASAGSAISLPAAPDRFSQLCPTCGTHLYASRQQIGQEATCGDCHTKTVIRPPALPRAKTTLLLSDSDDGYQLSREEPHQRPQVQPLDGSPIREAAPPQTTPPPRIVIRPSEVGPSQTVQTACSFCQAWLTVGAEQAGTKIVCPYCQALTEVRAAVAAPPATTHSLPAGPNQQAPNVPLAAPQRVESIALAPQDDSRKRAAEDQLRDAQRELFGDESKKAKLDRPFIDGVFTFLFDPGATFNWMVVSIIMLVEVTMLGAFFRAATSPGMGQLAALPMLPFALVLGFGGMMWASIHCLCVAQDTADGSARVESTPSLNVFEWLFESMYVVCSLTFAAIPASFIGWALSAFGLPAGLTTMILMLPTFPFILLSTLDAGSPIAPYSPEVFRSLTESTHAWGKFYAISSPVAILGFVFFVVSEAFGASLIGILVGLPCCLIAGAMVMIYFRLLGRLTWVCMQEANAKIKAERKRKTADASQQTPAQ